MRAHVMSHLFYRYKIFFKKLILFGKILFVISISGVPIGSLSQLSAYLSCGRIWKLIVLRTAKSMNKKLNF